MTLKAIAAILFGLALCASTVAQQHAPLLATCEADVALWYNSHEFTDYNKAQTAFNVDKTPNKTKLNLLPLDEIIRDSLGNLYRRFRLEDFQQTHCACLYPFRRRFHLHTT